MIPKVGSPEIVHQLRPNSLRTILYNVVTKVIVNRLKPYLSSWVLRNQSSFVPNRNITDNVVITQEIIHSMRKTARRKRWSTIKIDLEKAYDRLEWCFIDDTLCGYWVSNKLRVAIMNCIRSVSARILWNGVEMECFNPTQGIRQGNPLSPYLFVLCMKRLAQTTCKNVASGGWKPIFFLSRNGPSISHLFFVEDLILFARVSLEQIDIIQRVLQEFCACSSHRVSVQKTQICFSENANNGLKQHLEVALVLKLLMILVSTWVCLCYMKG